MRKEATNVFLVKGSEVCLGMKKRGFGAGNWNGTGGKIELGESVIDAAKREAKEEFGVVLKELEDMGETMFIFKDGLEIHCHIFVCKNWDGVPIEGEEMAPKWFKIKEIPLDKMWSTDISWVPMILEGKRVRGKYYFNEDAKTIEKFSLEEVN